MTLKYSATRAIEIVHVLTEVIFISELFTSGEKIDYSHPNGVIQGSLEHAIFLTLTLSIDNGSNSKYSGTLQGKRMRQKIPVISSLLYSFMKRRLIRSFMI